MEAPGIYFNENPREIKWFGPFKICEKVGKKKWYIWNDELKGTMVDESLIKPMEERDFKVRAEFWEKEFRTKKEVMEKKDEGTP
ncbi:hypothetical protein A2U01_0052757 [Trifolium medium]|uniref:Uncharacterized protein n=1 Tax=Trifolium medium TaxID=97028 RepID=A0A392R7M6_9FABA|nr:hypothetical protein [Trifolium medium]